MTPVRLALPLFALLTACSEGGGLNFFSIEDDIELGQQVKDEIDADPATYPVLDESEYADAYAHLYEMRDEVLASDEILFKEDFAWELYIIDDDETLNAFAAPGGYIWVYTGLLKYLLEEDHFVGVLGHEIAHADRRHSTEQLTKIYGITTLISVALGEDPGLAAEIAAGLVSLSFSREHESDADEYSVRYLCDTLWASNGAAGFFEQIVAEGGVDIPEFISTHPSSEDRVEDINAMAEELGCPTELNPDADWQAFLDTLPQ
jgi:beta-barrel assembly-enhancing protease